ncbi:hypothetical protein COB21_04080 [Candidatus Aerophobetes bacterium]|uniref:LysM domain-containing protein n=1 Tax=Aerophobetes bacterium TaxID=2030807 RepID=A0A2A4X340_UNCAE|nr:MAG: hypothetical protein COB21_04080 [Candidatus Aerophobetes bacterium]
MNKKDIIIAAMLINSVMLLAIFAFSKKSKSIPAENLFPKVAVSSSMVASHAPITSQVAQPVLKLKETAALAKVEKAKVSLAKKVEQKVVKGAYQDASITLKVKQGDMLEKIAKQFGVGVKSIMEVNQLKNTRLKIGQKLIIPQRIAKTKVVETTASEAAYYTVQPGENPWTIAKKNNIQVDQLLKLNNMNKQSAKTLRPGNKLRIK